MATYVEMAPIISGTGITRITVETAFGNLPEDVPPTPLPDTIKSKVNIVFNAYMVDKTLERDGLIGVARQAGLKISQVKAIINELNVLKAAWDILQLPPEPEE